MRQDCGFSQGNGAHRVCGLLGTEESNARKSDGQIVALREIVEHFSVQWELTTQAIGDHENRLQSGFTLDIKGSHEPSCQHTGEPCSHCANLMLALRIIGEWLLPPDGRCALCEAETCSTYVHGDKQSQGEACSTRTLRITSGPGTPCQVAQCHASCMTEIKERLAVLGAVERKGKRSLSRRAES